MVAETELIHEFVHGSARSVGRVGANDDCLVCSEERLYALYCAWKRSLSVVQDAKLVEEHDVVGLARFLYTLLDDDWRVQEQRE